MNGWGGDWRPALRGPDRAEADPGVRAIVLTGGGRVCAGADMGDLNSIGSHRPERR